MRERYHRLTLRIARSSYERLGAAARSSGLGLGEQGRQALDRGLDQTGPGGLPPAINERLDQLQVSSLAGLIAAEQVVRYMAKHHPEGEPRMQALRESAVEEAERRLEEVKVRLDQGGDQR